MQCDHSGSSVTLVSCERQVVLRPRSDRAPTVLWLCFERASTVLRPCSDRASTVLRPCSDRAPTVLWLCIDRAPTVLRQNITVRNSCREHADRAATSLCALSGTWYGSCSYPRGGVDAKHSMSAHLPPLHMPCIVYSGWHAESANPSMASGFRYYILCLNAILTLAYKQQRL